MAPDAVFNTAATQILFTCVHNTSSPLPFGPDAREVRSSSLLVLLPPLPPLSQGLRRCFPALLTPGLFHQALSFCLGRGGWGGWIGIYSHPCLFTIPAIKGQALFPEERPERFADVFCTQNDPRRLPPGKGLRDAPLALPRQN